MSPGRSLWRERRRPCNMIEHLKTIWYSHSGEVKGWNVQQLSVLRSISLLASSANVGLIALNQSVYCKDLGMFSWQERHWHKLYTRKVISEAN